MTIFTTCSNKSKSNTESMIFLGSPIIKTLDRDLPSDLAKIRITAVVNNLDLIDEQIADIELKYYSNLNRFLLPTEEQKNSIAEYLNIDKSKKNEWFLNWNNKMTKEEVQRAKKIIGINFCEKIPESKIEKGYYPIINLEFFQQLGKYNYVSDILEAYELDKLFQVQSFSTEIEAFSWGIFQIQAVRMQYAYFEYALNDDYNDKLPLLTKNYIGGMNNDELKKHFQEFTEQNSDLFNNESLKNMISVVKN